MPTNSHRQLITRDGKLATRSERHRESIRVGKAIKYLHDVVDGTEEANAVRVNAAKFLINKVVPDPRPEAVDDPLAHAKDITHKDPHALLRIIEGEAARKAG
jgi:hypothetical protein